MGLPAEKLVVGTNENDILDRFWKYGEYTKKPKAKDVHLADKEDGEPPEPVKETLSPAMDILVSSNFERLLWFLAYEVYGEGEVSQKRQIAGKTVQGWLNDLKDQGGFTVEPKLLAAAQREFESERVTDAETIETIRSIYSTCFPPPPASNGTRGETGGYILDPHSAVGVAASLRSIARVPDQYHISLSTAHPAKFAGAVDMALRGEKGYSFDSVLPPEFIGLEAKERRVIAVPAGEGWPAVRTIINSKVSV
jgi:threonine synthase